MFKFGPIVILGKSELQKYQDVVDNAYALHQHIWFYGENNSFPPELSELPVLDELLADALSRVPENV